MPRTRVWPTRLRHGGPHCYPGALEQTGPQFRWAVVVRIQQDKDTPVIAAEMRGQTRAAFQFPLFHDALAGYPYRP